LHKSLQISLCGYSLSFQEDSWQSLPQYSVMEHFAQR